ncbi:CDP-diacylglycerol--glycerol-3-phosphate 3-phosphatidyltransferase [bacterium]|nr:CDP-diacylglycerol--glycerol-3-phosphate 3-phosphatidyltransferase [bacterium]
MNLANKLTISRIFMAVVFTFLLLIDLKYTNILAAVVFILACITDWIDGKVARHFQVESDFGKLVDPLADKILICAAFISFIEIPAIKLPAWIVIIIISREFVITGLRLLAANKGVVVPAGIWGKNKTISQIILIISLLLYLSALDINANITNICISQSLKQIFYWYFVVMVIITIILTVLSGIVYLIKNWNLLKGY